MKSVFQGTDDALNAVPRAFGRRLIRCRWAAGWTLLDNAGVVNWKGAGALTLLWGGDYMHTYLSITNLPGGVLDCQVDGQLSGDNYSSWVNIHNGGILRKSGGSGTTGIGAPFVNEGTVEVQRGALQVNGQFIETPGANLVVAMGGVTPGT